MFIGIDNGLTGGIAILEDDGAVYETFIMPTKLGPSSRGVSTNIIDARKLAKIIARPDVTHIAVEKPAGAENYNAAVSMADSFASIRTVVECTGKRLHAVSAYNWQRHFWPSPPRTPKGQERPAKYDPKYLAAIAARKQWPGRVFLGTPQSTTSHKGIIDALLICEYVRFKTLHPDTLFPDL